MAGYWPSSFFVCFGQYPAILVNYCWRALARQRPILCNSEKKAKSVGCKIEDMRSRLFFLYRGISGGL